MKSYMESFAENLRELIGNEQSVNEFAKKIDIPATTLYRYLNCKREVTITYLCKIADYFDEDIDYLLGRKS